jgi:hypothetical protein
MIIAHITLFLEYLVLTEFGNEGEVIRSHLRQNRTASTVRRK